MHRKRKTYGHQGRRHAARRVGRVTAAVVAGSLLALALLSRGI